MKRRVVVMATAVALFLCGCEDAGQSRSIDADIERARARISAKTEEKQRIEVEVRKYDLLVPEREKLQQQYRELVAERDRLAADLKKPPHPRAYGTSSSAKPSGHSTTQPPSSKVPHLTDILKPTDSRHSGDEQ